MKAILAGALGELWALYITVEISVSSIFCFLPFSFLFLPSSILREKNVFLEHAVKKKTTLNKCQD